MPLIWRAMRADGENPEVGRDAAALGVRVGDGENDDINPDGDGFVNPGIGGMSVSPSVDAFPVWRIPKRLRDKFPDRFPQASGSNRLCCWWMGEGAFEAGPVADGLLLRLDPRRPERHGFVEPNGKMAVADYQQALVNTREQWNRWEV